MYWLLLLFFLVSCNSVTPIDDNFVRLYAELRVATTEHGPATPNARMARQNLMRQYGYTLENFEIQVRNIQQNYELWNEFQAKVIAQFDTLMQKNAATIVAPVPMPGKMDSANPHKKQRIKQEGLRKIINHRPQIKPQTKEGER